MKEAPQYRAPFSVISNLTTIYLDWSHSFVLNGELKEYILTENAVWLYSGLRSSLHLPRTSDKTLKFQVTCITDTGKVSTPVIKYNAATGIGPVESSPGGKTGMQGVKTKFYTELWFIILMAVLGLILLAIFIALLLQKVLSKAPFVRERPPLVPLQKRAPAISVYPPSDTGMFDSVPEISASSSSVTLKSFTLHLEGLTDPKSAAARRHGGNSGDRRMSVIHVPSESQLSRVYSQSSLHRSVSELIHDKKSLIEDSVWDNIGQNHSAKLFEDEDFIDSIKGFSTVRKEHTMFTDTNL
ncbi:usherin isoform X1 [Polypterus senegalus]|uniref:usherin isoform X1 n=1 Tax=Polypterus senegalus TaxID=55291 RepID=UPI001965FFBD|nr:usherin isoform X1 [Polypterus senegalus]XP_039594729.1 usherin isoform X1 [Polypterus senegalus]XP_039594730.1 usherin isoform X1 [Polypterus senegalus]